MDRKIELDKTAREFNRIQVEAQRGGDPDPNFERGFPCWTCGVRIPDYTHTDEGYCPHCGAFTTQQDDRGTEPDLSVELFEADGPFCFLPWELYMREHGVTRSLTVYHWQGRRIDVRWIPSEQVFETCVYFDGGRTEYTTGAEDMDDATREARFVIVGKSEHAVPFRTDGDR